MVSTLSRVSETRATDDGDATPLSPAEREAIASRVKALDSILADETKFKARYRLELLFGEERSRERPVLGAVTFWESGSQLHGGGDGRIYLCPGKRLKKNDCTAPIPFAVASRGVFACPKCKEVWESGRDRALVIGEVLGRHTMQQWATVLLHYFRILDHHCDVTLKFSPTDIRSKALVEQRRDRGGELLAKARRRAKAVYPLKNIIKDMNAGADPYRRMFAFVTA